MTIMILASIVYIAFSYALRRNPILFLYSGSNYSVTFANFNKKQFVATNGFMEKLISIIGLGDVKCNEIFYPCIPNICRLFSKMIL